MPRKSRSNSSRISRDCFNAKISIQNVIHGMYIFGQQTFQKILKDVFIGEFSFQFLKQIYKHFFLARIAFGKKSFEAAIYSRNLARRLNGNNSNSLFKAVQQSSKEF